METLGEFKRRIKKVNQPREYKVRNSLGVYDGYKYYRKNKPDSKKYVLTESQYFAIIRKINLLLVGDLSAGCKFTASTYGMIIGIYRAIPQLDYAHVGIDLIS